jgi:hypothetical protein
MSASRASTILSDQAYAVIAVAFPPDRTDQACDALKGGAITSDSRMQWDPLRRVLREINEIYFREALSVLRVLRDDFRRDTSQGGMWILNLVSSRAGGSAAADSCRRHQARLLVPAQLQLS